MVQNRVVLGVLDAVGDPCTVSVSHHVGLKSLLYNAGGVSGPKFLWQSRMFRVVGLDDRWQLKRVVRTTTVGDSGNRGQCRSQGRQRYGLCVFRLHTIGLMSILKFHSGVSGGAQRRRASQRWQCCAILNAWQGARECTWVRVGALWRTGRRWGCAGNVVSMRRVW